MSVVVRVAMAPSRKRKLPPSATTTKQTTLEKLLQPVDPGSLFPSTSAPRPVLDDTDDELCGDKGELPKKIRSPGFSPQRPGPSGLVSRQLSAESDSSLRRSSRTTRWMGGSSSGSTGTTPASQHSVRSLVDPNDKDYVQPPRCDSDSGE